MKKFFFTFYSILVVAIIVILWGTDILINVVYSDTSYNKIEPESQFILKSMDHFIVEMDKYPESKRDEYLALMKKSFGNSVDLKQLNEIDLTKDEITQLESGLNVFTGNENDLFITRKVPDKNIALVLGPFGNPDLMGLLDLIYVGIACLLLSIPALVWSFLIWRDLKKIQTATDAYGAGNFAVRIKSSSFSSMGNLSNIINNMAEQVGNLIRSHKDLTNFVSHELRTPLARLKFGIEILKSPSEYETLEEQLEDLEGDVSEIESFVDEILMYAKFDRKPEIVQPVKYDVVYFLSGIVATENSFYKNRNISFFTEEDDDCTACFDPKFMEWAVRNLVKNAGIYSETKVRVIFQASGKNCIVHVDDDGSGIPESEREKVFIPFARLDSSRTKKTGGYGLGLSIVEKIARWHGGNVSITDSESGGARFTLEWPGFV